jgi:hypothetical protein
MTDTSNKSREAIFIPPPGAMQFELREFPGLCAWVRPESTPVQFNQHCKCTEGHTVVPGGLPKGLGPSKSVGDPTHWNMALCACIGRIIE